MNIVKSINLCIEANKALIPVNSLIAASNFLQLSDAGSFAAC